MKLKLTPLPPYTSKPGTERYQFFYNGVKIPVERTAAGIWRCWISCLREAESIELSSVSQAAAEEALSRLLLMHFAPLISMLREVERVSPVPV
jgi:hypothetical protein